MTMWFDFGLSMSRGEKKRRGYDVKRYVLSLGIFLIQLISVVGYPHSLNPPLHLLSPPTQKRFTCLFVVVVLSEFFFWNFHSNFSFFLSFCFYYTISFEYCVLFIYFLFFFIVCSRRSRSRNRRRIMSNEFDFISFFVTFLFVLFLNLLELGEWTLNYNPLAVSSYSLLLESPYLYTILTLPAIITSILISHNIPLHLPTSSWFVVFYSFVVIKNGDYLSVCVCDVKRFAGSSFFSLARIIHVKFG